MRRAAKRPDDARYGAQRLDQGPCHYQNYAVGHAAFSFYADLRDEAECTRRSTGSRVVFPLLCGFDMFDGGKPSFRLFAQFLNDGPELIYQDAVPSVLHGADIDPTRAYYLDK